MMREKLRHPPQIGMRMVKSAAAVFLCLLLSVLWNREDMRIYSSIAALWCIRPYHGDTKKMAIQRISGTAVGTAYGALAILAELYLLPGIRGTVPGYLLIAAFILPVLWTTVWLGLENASYFSCVVFLSITVAHMIDGNPWLFVWHRAAETLIGILDNVLMIYHGPLYGEAAQALQAAGITEQVKWKFYPSTDYPGFSYIKIYEKSASRQAMLELLKQDLGVEKAVTFGSIEGQADVVLQDDTGNRVVKVLERMYEPYLWEKHDR